METVAGIRDMIARGDRSAVDVTREALARARRAEPLGAFLSTLDDAALAAAETIDRRRADGEALGPLAGVPIALKDAICAEGSVTTAGSRALEGWRAPYDATVVARLREAGAVVYAKTNMDEFAMGSSNENSAFGPARNPHDLSRAPGGSSGGSAVAVAAGVSPAALGSDTGGSIRQPAAFTGVVGVKPSYGRVSRFGLVAFASSLDQIGPFATDVRGAARVLDVISGADPRDMTSRDLPRGELERACDRDVRGLRLGVPEEYFAEGLEPEVEARVREAIAALEGRGCVVTPVHLPHTRHAVATYYVIATAEASSNLSRYDGVRYGLRVDPGEGLATMYGRTRDAAFGREVKRRILLGTYVLSAGHYDAYYARAQRVRTKIARDFDAAFAEVDAVVCPTSPTTAFALGERTRDPLAMYLSDVYTLPASLAGIPAVSVPCRPSASGLPVGLQIVTRRDDEATALALAAAWEAERGALPGAPHAVWS